MPAMSPVSPAARARPLRGTGAVELLCCAAITATLAGAALPTLVDLAQRQRLRAAAAELQADLNLARSTALLRSKPVRLSWQSIPAVGSCYIVHTGDAEQCSCASDLTSRCDPQVQVVRTGMLPAAQSIGLSAATRSVLFDGRKSTVTPTATFKLSDSRGHTMHLVVNIVGRVRNCSPGGALAGVKPC